MRATVHAVTQANYPKEIYAEMLVEEKCLKFQVDSGASVNIIPARFVEGTEMQTTTKMLQMWNYTTLKPQGSCRVILRNPINKRKYSVEFLVITKNLTLIGARAAQQMGLITVNQENFKFTKPPKHFGSEVKSVKTTEEIVQNFPEVFQSELGTLAGTVHLEVDLSATPMAIPPHRLPTALKGQLKQELDRLQQLEVLAPIDEPTPWVSSLAVAVKKSGPLNTALKREICISYQ